MQTHNQIETSIGTLEIKDGILFLIIKKDVNVELDTAIEAVEARKVIQKGEKMLFLVDNRNIWQLTKEAQAYSSSKEVGDLSLAMAILSGTSLPAMLISNFFMRFNKVHCPTKTFKNEDKALDWLNQFK